MSLQSDEYLQRLLAIKGIYDVPVSTENDEDAQFSRKAREFYANPFLPQYVLDVVNEVATSDKGERCTKESIYRRAKSFYMSYGIVNFDLFTY